MTAIKFINMHGTGLSMGVFSNREKELEVQNASMKAEIERLKSEMGRFGGSVKADIAKINITETEILHLLIRTRSYIFHFASKLSEMKKKAGLASNMGKNISTCMSWCRKCIVDISELEPLLSEDKKKISKGFAKFEDIILTFDREFLNVVKDEKPKIEDTIKYYIEHMKSSPPPYTADIKKINDILAARFNMLLSSFKNCIEILDKFREDPASKAPELKSIIESSIKDARAILIEIVDIVKKYKNDMYLYELSIQEIERLTGVPMETHPKEMPKSQKHGKKKR
jgi:hypothetical protein